MNAQRVRELLCYDPATGAFSWRVTLGARAQAGKPAGSPTANGYWCIRLDKRLYQAHRLAWLYVTGEWPSQDIDHKNGQRADNRFDNLRDVPNALNRQNTHAARKDSGSGVQGVARYKRTGRFQAQLKVRGKNVYLGIYDTVDEASLAYRDAKAQLHEAWEGAKPALLSDNYAVNLRGDRRVRCDNRTGLLGVGVHTDGRYRARIKSGGRYVHLGLFDTPEAAHAAYLNARQALRG